MQPEPLFVPLESGRDFFQATYPHQSSMKDLQDSGSACAFSEAEKVCSHSYGSGRRWFQNPASIRNRTYCILFALDGTLYRFDDNDDKLNSIISMSTDGGINWSFHAHSPWFSRWDFEVVTTKQGDSWLIYVLGGVANTATSPEDIYLSDVLVTADRCIAWKTITTAAAWGPRGGLKCTAAGPGTLIVYGGICEDEDDDGNWHFTVFRDVWTSKNSGSSWKRLHTNLNVSSMIYHNDRLLAISDAKLISSTDFAQSWLHTPVTFVPSTILSDVVIPRLVCISHHGLFESIDGGLTWLMLTQVPPAPGAFDFLFINGDLVAMNKQSGVSWRSPVERWKLLRDKQFTVSLFVDRLASDLVVSALVPLLFPDI